ncbi:uncharacterized protein LOC18022838 [Eutrema salsugineum]|uniref:uncharacterized protein LOC18022838 n=1 Tax=Eutrema salsugineum TaxID=72664 RepID=UPI000CED6BFA|nr:uncharacterized protein LOC18022838 [Eutrema salsugineum]
MPENANHSPRISFSDDFCYTGSIPIEQSPLRPPSEYSSLNFDFSIPGGVISGESSWSAEEFFNDGMILPTEIKKCPEPGKDKTSLLKPEMNPIGAVKPVHEIEEIDEYEEVAVIEERPNGQTFMGFKKIKKRRELGIYETGLIKPDTNPIGDVKPVVEIEEIEEDEVAKVTEEKPNTLSFWGFNKRSNSLKSEFGLPLLSKNPTGSNSKQTETKKLQVSSSLSSFSSSSSSSNCSFQQQPLKEKNYRGYNYGGNGGGIRVNSILDMIPSGSLFGLRSIILGSGSETRRVQ